MLVGVSGQRHPQCGVRQDGRLLGPRQQVQPPPRVVRRRVALGQRPRGVREEEGPGGAGGSLGRGQVKDGGWRIERRAVLFSV